MDSYHWLQYPGIIADDADDNFGSTLGDELIRQQPEKHDLANQILKEQVEELQEIDASLISAYSEIDSPGRRRKNLEKYYSSSRGM